MMGSLIHQQNAQRHRDELSVCNGIVLKGHNRIIVPESLQAQAVNILHNKAHLGLNKTLE